MSILIGVGIVTTVTTFYLAKKGWRAFHNAVGISPGVLTYQDYDAPLSIASISWQQLKLDKEYLKNVSAQQLRQLQRIDKKVNSYQAYQKALQAQHKTSAVTEQQFILHKMLHTRLPEVLANHHLTTIVRSNINISTSDVSSEKHAEANELLQKIIDNIEQRLDNLIAEIEAQQLQELRIIDSYIKSHDS